MKLFSALSIATLALIALVDFGTAYPVRLDRRDPVTKVVEYVHYGDHQPSPSKPEPANYRPAPPPPQYEHERPTYQGLGPNDEREVLCLVNKERRRVGLRPLALHPAVTRAAYEHSSYQSRIQSMTHSDPQNGQVGSRLQRNGFNFASAAENIAEAPHASAKEVFDMWISDPPHYENIVDPNATYMGLACINGFWTQDFGSSTDTRDAPEHSAQDYC